MVRQRSRAVGNAFRGVPRPAVQPSPRHSLNATEGVPYKLIRTGSPSPTFPVPDFRHCWIRPPMARIIVLDSIAQEGLDMLAAAPGIEYEVRTGLKGDALRQALA